MNQKQERLLFKTLLYLVGATKPQAGFAELVEELRFEWKKCGELTCGNKGEHIHPIS